MYVVHFQVIQTRKSPVFRNTFLRERQSPCLLNNILHYLGFLRWFYIFSDLIPSNPLQKIHPKLRVGKRNLYASEKASSPLKLGELSPLLSNYFFIFSYQEKNLRSKIYLSKNHILSVNF